MPEPIPAPVLEDSVAPAPAPAPDPAPADGGVAPKADAPADGGGTPAPAAPEPELFELPDGRKVDAATLSKEWKENFLPEFTRKSQLLADKERAPSAKEVPSDQPEWMRPDYQPKSYAEIIEIATQQAIERLGKDALAEEAQAKAVADEVDKTVASLKAKDPQLDENALFNHALKFGFRDLNAAYANMTAFRDIARETEERVKAGHGRKDPIAGGGNAPAAGNGAIVPGAHSNFRSATEFLRSIKG